MLEIEDISKIETIEQGQESSQRHDPKIIEELAANLDRQRQLMMEVRTARDADATKLIFQKIDRLQDEENRLWALLGTSRRNQRLS
jgi:hypothetical protein